MGGGGRAGMEQWSGNWRASSRPASRMRAWLLSARSNTSMCAKCGPGRSAPAHLRVLAAAAAAGAMPSVQPCSSAALAPARRFASKLARCHCSLGLRAGWGGGQQRMDSSALWRSLMQLEGCASSALGLQGGAQDCQAECVLSCSHLSGPATWLLSATSGAGAYLHGAERGVRGRAVRSCAAAQ